jgi:predicted SprT family Zn-dependent metalloprotease
MTRAQMVAEFERIKAGLLERCPSLANVTLKINTRLRRANGRAKYISRVMEMSSFRFVENSLNDHLAANTILHEFAHFIAWDLHRYRGHCFPWKQIARSIGCTGDRCSQGMKLVDGVDLECPRCHHKYHESTKRLRKIEAQGRGLTCKCGKIVPFPWPNKAVTEALSRESMVRRIQQTGLTPQDPEVG